MLPQKKGKGLEGSGEKGGLAPSDLQSAYKIPVTGGEGQTVALVDAYGYSTAEEDVAKYRQRYKLPPCTTANGCFRKVNQEGEQANYPPDNEGWDTEQALDIEMVSAACPSCHIILAEADEPSSESLGATVDTAARLGATEISNSYGGLEEQCPEGEQAECEEEVVDFDHPGILVTASGGDYGYDDHERGGESPNSPAALPTVVSVGGTNLHKASNARRWEDTAWEDGGSGCSVAEPKPPWQHDSGCSMRMSTDVAAVGGCETPVSTYSHYGGWNLVCGTSVSSPLVAGIEAHATPYARSLPGADAFYNDPSAFFDVTKGSNGTCTPPSEHAYYCTAQAGYDGPTGNGVPDGPLELSAAPPAVVTQPASDVSGEGATLHGELAAQGAAASYRFEYGTSENYGSDAPIPDGEVPAGTAPTTVNTSITGLQPEKVYHYRLAASGPGGTSYGADELLVTGAPSIGAIEPSDGPDHGETSVTITGQNLDGATGVVFGSHPASSFKVTSDETITALSPPGTGTAAVRVITPAGESAENPAVSFAYESPGAVLSWGRNEGNLGNGRTADSRLPGEILDIPEAAQLSAGVWVNLALTTGGRVLTWGRNGGETIGNGSKAYEPVTSPIPVCTAGRQEPCPGGPYLEGAVQVAAGWNHSLALLADGRVVAWGANFNGQLGRGSEGSREEPGYVCTSTEGVAGEGACKPGDYLEEVTSIAAGTEFSLALLRNGTVLAFGNNSEDQLGTAKGVGPEACRLNSKEHCSSVPIPVAGLEHVKAIAAGQNTSLALLQDGSVMAWGANTDGQLGDGSDEPAYGPVAVCAVAQLAPCSQDLKGAKAVSAGYHFGVAVLEDGTVVDWGENFNGSLGTGSREGPETCGEERHCSRIPLEVPGIGPVQRATTGVFDNSVLAVTDAGEILAWGEGSFGQLGDGFGHGDPSPTRVCGAYNGGPCPSGPYLEGAVTALAVGGQHVLIGFMSSRPLVGGVSPDEGPRSGGTEVTITGSNLSGATAVDFGEAPASEFEVVSDKEIRAITPPGRRLVDVTVATPAGTTERTPADEFAYLTAPEVVTEGASGVARTSAVLGAMVDPDGSLVFECGFQYGTSTEYGSTAACSKLPGSGIAPVAVSATISGLEAGTTYHFRVLASNGHGTSYGEDVTFTTPVSELPELGRCTKLAGTPTGRYSNKGCTATSKGEDSGPYEWQPGPGEGRTFMGSGAVTGLWVAGKRENVSKVLECESNVLDGAYGGPHSGSAELDLSGCQLFQLGSGGTCNSPHSNVGEIIAPVLADLLAVPHGKRALDEIELAPPEGAATTFECSGGKVTAKIQGLGGLTPANKMTTAFSATLKGSSKQAGLAVTETISNAEPLEFKTKP